MNDIESIRDKRLADNLCRIVANKLRKTGMNDEYYGETYVEAKAVFEMTWLSMLMQKYKYNQVKVAKEMQMSRGTLRTLLKKYYGNQFFRNTND